MKQKNIIKYIFISILIILIIYLISKENLTEGYNNTSIAYVINLDKRTDRWLEISKKFRYSSITLERVSAVEHVKGHTGCGLSFMKIVKKSKDDNLKTVLIFEDDNKPLEGFNARWLIIKEWLDNNLDAWDIYNGGARFPDWSKYEYNDTSPYMHETKLAYSIGNNEYIFQSPIVFALNWTYINRKAYDKVLKWETLVKKDRSLDGIDSYLGSRKYFNTVFSIPVLALQESGKSDTESDLYQDFEKTDKIVIKIFNKIYNKEVGAISDL